MRRGHCIWAKGGKEARIKTHRYIITPLPHNTISKPQMCIEMPSRRTTLLHARLLSALVWKLLWSSSTPAPLMTSPQFRLHPQCLPPALFLSLQIPQRLPTMTTLAESLQQNHEPRPDPQTLTSNPDPSKNASTGVDYEPHPSQSIDISPEREGIINAITRLYSGSASEEDMQVYAKEAIYDDPWSYCDTRYKIAGQWYGM